MEIPKKHIDYKKIGMDENGGIILQYDNFHTYIPPKETKALAYFMICELGIEISKPKDIKYKEE